MWATAYFLLGALPDGKGVMLYSLGAMMSIVRDAELRSCASSHEVAFRTKTALCATGRRKK